MRTTKICVLIMSGMLMCTLSACGKGSSANTQTDSAVQTENQDLSDDNAPKELGDDISSLIFSFEGDLYRLPAPVSAFTANGWEIYGDRSGYVGLKRDGKKVELGIDGDTAGETSLVNNITIWDYHNIDFVLPGEITIGSTKEDVEKVLSEGQGAEVKRSESADIWEYPCEEENFQMYVTVVYEGDSVLSLTLGLKAPEK